MTIMSFEWQNIIRLRINRERALNYQAICLPITWRNVIIKHEFEDTKGAIRIRIITILKTYILKGIMGLEHISFDITSTVIHIAGFRCFIVIPTRYFFVAYRQHFMWHVTHYWNNKYQINNTYKIHNNIHPDKRNRKEEANMFLSHKS